MMDDGRIFWDGMEFRVMFFVTTILLSRAICYADVFFFVSLGMTCMWMILGVVFLWFCKLGYDSYRKGKFTGVSSLIFLTNIPT